MYWRSIELLCIPLCLGALVVARLNKYEQKGETNAQTKV